MNSGGGSSPNRFFIDSRSLEIGAGDVVGYTLVVLAPSGVRNTTFEGLRWCNLERKIYAVGRHYGSGVESSGPRGSAFPIPATIASMSYWPTNISATSWCLTVVPK